jgi:hypothetical protein
VDLATVGARDRRHLSQAIRGKDHAAAQCWDAIKRRSRDETEKPNTVN